MLRYRSARPRTIGPAPRYPHARPLLVVAALAAGTASACGALPIEYDADASTALDASDDASDAGVDADTDAQTDADADRVSAEASVARDD